MCGAPAGSDPPPPPLRRGPGGQGQDQGQNQRQRQRQRQLQLQLQLQGLVRRLLRAVQKRWKPRAPVPSLLWERLQPRALAATAYRVAAKRSNAATASSTVTRSITPSRSIFVPHFNSLAGLPRYLRAAS